MMAYLGGKGHELVWDLVLVDGIYPNRAYRIGRLKYKSAASAH